MANSPTFLCIASYFKGSDFIRYCKNEGCTVYLVTSKKLEHEDWPRESLDDIFYVQQDEHDRWDMKTVTAGVAYLLRERSIDRIIALDDFDVEKATQLREYFRIPGMGATTGHYFRDKLAMRIRAAEAGIPVPAFSPLFNSTAIHEYSQRVLPPWVVKPRSEASATGIKKIHHVDQLWEHLNHTLGETRHAFLVEQFRPGAVYHIDSLSVGGKVIFSRASQYLTTPLDVVQSGGVFRSHTINMGSDDEQALFALNEQVLTAFGLQFGASHSEYIKDNETGKFVFLETSSRVGGAHLAEMVEFASGINLWGEWARIEVAMQQGKPYQLPPVRHDYAGIIVSLSRHQHPDSSRFADPEIVWRLRKAYHIGLIVQATTTDRVLQLLHQYVGEVFNDFHTSAPPKQVRPVD